MTAREQEVIDRASKELAAIRAENQTCDTERLAQGECRAPKPWVEASIEEKLERTRQMVKSLQQTANYLSDRTQQALNLRDDLIEHRHAIDDGGKVMLPADGGRKRLNDYGGCCTQAAEVAPELAYF